MKNDYRSAYRREAEKTAKLKSRLAGMENEAEELESRTAHIKGSKAFRLSKPLRVTYHHLKIFIRQKKFIISDVTFVRDILKILFVFPYGIA